MFVVYWNETDDLDFTYQCSKKLDSEIAAKAFVARLMFMGHREAFYRYE